MANNCLDTKLLSYGGTSQAQRALDALLTNAAKVDERTTADLILFTKKYGAYLNYYDITNVIAGDWEQLMGNDVAVVIASVADWRTKDFAPFLKYLNDKIVNAGNDADAKKYFKVLFDFVFSLASNLDFSLRRLPVDIDYNTFLSVSIISKIAAPLSVLRQYYGTFKTSLLIDDTSTFTDALTPVENIVLSQNFDISGLSVQFAVVPVIPAFPITLSGGGVREDIDLILTHNLFTGALQSFTDAIINIVSRTPDYLAETLADYPTHAPHYALYLTFLKLFSFTQQHLNQYTKRHLDFYYKEVLRLSNRAAEPDFVHLVFELQKNITQHLLPEGTSFKAGKDANNNDLFYSLTNDLVVQTAGVQALKSVYLNKDVSPVTLYGSPKADSEDGQGGKLLSADSSWFPFGDPKKVKQAAIGFAIASNVLYLNEGSRTIVFTFSCDDLGSITADDLSGIFTIQLTGKKSMYTVPGYAASLINSTSFSLTVTLEGDAPAIAPYSSKLHGGNFTVALPMAQVMLDNYKSYQKIKIPRIKEVAVSVTVNNVKNLVLQNDNGKINPAKPFKPFGDFPESGASFIIGSKEIFQKSLTELIININWHEPLPVAKANINVSTLSRGDWSSVSGADAVSLFASKIAINKLPLFIAGEFVDIFNLSPTITSGSGNAVTANIGGNIVANMGLGLVSNIYLNLYPLAQVQVAGLNSVAKSPADFTANDDYVITSVDGFIKLDLVGDDYSLSTFLSQIPQPSVTAHYDNSDPPKVTSYTVDKTKPPVATPPVMTSVNVTYSAEDSITFAGDFNTRTNFFYHIEPFGFRELHPSITDDNINLLPVFNLEDNSTNDDGGELWIGLNNAIADETFCILFQVSDGSANPLKNMTQVDWYYMSNNNWLPFKKQSVTDFTNNLTRSGLVIVNVPADATIANTRADNNLIWIKGAVKHDTDAVCNLIAVDINAGKAQFVTDLTNDIEFTKVLAQNTISKPAVADASLKKTQQPFASFDGRIRETDDQFYVRVSERLRHKHRAITAWDYERLTLQYFPQIFKVKCIDHTGFVLDEKTNTQKYSETLAGHVTVITIPDLTNLNFANLLRPYTSIGLLTEIEQYLQGLTSPFVKLKLCNPQFEEVQFDFSVSFRENYDPVFFTNQLNNEIEQFLTPWAFNNPQAIAFGNTIEKSVVLNFVEERYYVDFVTCFKMNQFIREGTTVKQVFYDIDEAIASTARSILVSYYNEETQVKHLISSTVNCDCNG